MKTHAETPDLRTLADRVRWARMQRGLSQTELAVRSGVSQGTIGNVESGERKDPRRLLDIARALYCSPEWLDTGRGEWDLATKAKAKGSVFEEHDEAEREMLHNWRLMMDDDRAELAAEIAKRAERFQANMEKVMKERGLSFAVPKRPSTAAKSAISKVAVATRQREPEETTRKK